MSLSLKAQQALEERRRRLAEEAEGRFPKPTLYSDNGTEELKKRVTLVDLINRLAGSNLIADRKEIKTNCPFPDHPDRNPSFSINTVDNLFCCHACNRAGDIYNFMAEFENLDYKTDFPKVKERVCQVMGITIENVKQTAMTVDKTVVDEEDGIFRLDVSGVRKVIYEHYPHLWQATEAGLSVAATLLLADLENPVGLNYVSDSSVGKTLVLRWFAEDEENCYRTDHFTPKSLVSHAANVKAKDREKIHMLPRMRDKVVLVADLAPMFRGRHDDILDNTIRLIRVFDGEGWIGDSGVAGRQGFIGQVLFAWLAATTPLDYKIWEIFSTLGTRWFFLYIPKDKKSAEERYKEQCAGLTDKQKTAECKAIVGAFLAKMFSKGNYVISWDITRDPADICIIIQRFADLVSVCRGLVRVGINEYRDDIQLQHSTPSIEAPYRANKILTSIARGHAIINGRTELSKDDLPIIKAIALSSMPDDRRAILPALIENDGRLTTNQILGVLRCSKQKALVSMEALSAVGLVKLVEEVSPLPWFIELEEDFRWLLGEEISDV